MPTDCGCEIEKDLTNIDGRVRGYRIVYCPLHAAAEAFRDATKRALGDVALILHGAPALYKAALWDALLPVQTVLNSIADSETQATQ